jgi:hypothetical protein
MTVSVSGTTITFNDATTQTTAPVNTNANVTSLAAGTGISLSATTGAITITNSSPGVVSSVNGQTGAVDTTTLGNIGSSMLLLYYGSTNGNAGITTAGSSLYRGTSYVSTPYGGQNATYIAGANSTTVTNNSYWNRSASGNVGSQPPNGCTTVSGTWRLMGQSQNQAAAAGYCPCGGTTETYGTASLYVRIS